MRKFLFVCTGNTCRSPLAEALLKEKRPDLEVQSAGVSALPGMDASEGAKEVLAEKGITCNHLSRQVDKTMMDWADIVLTLTESHKSVLNKQFPQSVEKIYTLKEYAVGDETKELEALLRKHYAQLERKQAQFFTEHKEIIDQLNVRNDAAAKKELENLSKKLQELIEEDRTEISKLEQRISSYDISDPFGGNVEIYRKTGKEIEDAIIEIVKRL